MNFDQGVSSTPLTDEKLADYMKRLDDDADEERAGENGGSGGKLAEKIETIRDKRTRHMAMLEELDRTGEDQMSLTDPDARHGTHDQSRRQL
jgi:hypothetical protein